MRTLGSWDSPNGPAKLVDFKDIDEELRYLRRLITLFRGNPTIRNLALQIIAEAQVPPREKKAQALAIGDWVQQNVYYVHELPERFQDPTETLRIKAGDCDDMTSFIGSLIESVGIPSVMVCMKVNGGWSHIFPAARIPETGGLLPLDATMRFAVSLGRNPVEWAKERGKHVVIKLA